MVALAAVLVPVLRREERRELGVALLHEAALRLRVVGWIALALLAATGAFQVVYRLGSLAPLGDAAFWASPWGRVLAAKLALVAVILGVQVVHDFSVGPRATALAREDPDAPAARRARRQASWIGRTSLVLSLAALALGVLLVRGCR